MSEVTKKEVTAIPSLVLAIKNRINALKLEGLSFKEIRKITAFSRELSSVLEEYQEAETKFFDSYGLKANEAGSVSWEGHKKSDKIKKEYLEIIKTELVLTKAEFLTEDQFGTLVENNDLKAGDIIVLEDYLLE